MSDAVEILIHHGYLLLFLWVLAENAGVPVPATPLLVAAGALVARGRLSLSATAAVAILAVMLSDGVWYALGRRYGSLVLRLLCKISLEADSCVRRTQLAFEKCGSKALAFAKFVPGLNVMTAPMAGVGAMPVRQFLVFDAIGAFLWSSAFISLGFAFSEQIDRVLKSFEILGAGLIVLVLVMLASYVGWKWARRRRLLKERRVARIDPQELKAKLDSGEDVIIVDVRDELEIESEPHTNPSGNLRKARRIRPRLT
jgi:membrane protein DedA with SNARE-associated domain